MATGQTLKLPAINKQIIEIKKKIQLSEGQRKALFEQIESERKRDTDEIVRLKGTISTLGVRMREEKLCALRTRMNVAQVKPVLRHVGDKTCQEVIAILDLQLIDRNKQLDVLIYKMKQKETILKDLASKYQEILSRTVKTKTSARSKPINQKILGEIRNKINAMDVQWRESEHVRSKYKIIKRALLEDAARFDSQMLQMNEELQGQQIEIEKLQQINSEASKMRAAARNALLQEEKLVVASGNAREKQAAEGNKLVQERKHDLEKFERRFYQAPKQQRMEVEDDSHKEDENDSSNIDPMEVYAEIFEALKETTGSSSTSDVLKKFQAQKATQIRLSELRENSELMKKKLEKTLDKYTVEHEQLKFVGDKDSEQNAEELNNIQTDIDEQYERGTELQSNISSLETVAKSVLEKLQSFYFNFNRNNKMEEDPVAILQFLQNIVQDISRRKVDEEEMEKQMESLDLNEEKWLPHPYVDILRRTPLPQHVSATPVPPQVGSEDEEEIPSRGFLKRQALMVVDAKTKRKALRFQMARRK